jgi:sterol desaturase/sphingolipid hydroxylase (fatty acid hydroxylase superfamily)
MKLLQIESFFGAPKIDYSHIVHLEKGSADLIVYAIPAMALFTLWEMWHSWHHDRKLYNARESFGSLLVGLGNVAINLAFKVGLIYGAVFMYNLVPWRMTLNWWTLLPCLIIFDLSSYVAHLVSHYQRFFWAAHVVHHSGVNYNLTVSFRLSWVQHFKIIFLLPVALSGFHPVIFFVTNQILVLFQFWQHTEYIRKLHPVIEYFIVTPSNHRVHHGSDEKYIDKNFGVMLVIWDKLFGTFQKEEEKPTYGLTTPIENSSNPLYLNFHEYKEIVEDVRAAKSWRKKLFYVFGSPTKIAREKKQAKMQLQEVN